MTFASAVGCCWSRWCRSPSCASDVCDMARPSGIAPIRTDSAREKKEFGQGSELLSFVVPFGAQVFVRDRCVTLQQSRVALSR